MKFLVLGATGKTGSLFVRSALDDGHEVTALVRSAGRSVDERAQTITGDVTDAPTVARASIEVDAIISALGSNGRRGKKSLMTDAVRAVVEAAPLSGVDRFLVVSAFGVGVTRRLASWPARLLFDTVVRNIYRDKAASEMILRASALRWTTVYPGALKDGPLTPYLAQDTARSAKVRGIPPTTRANVADFLLRSAIATLHGGGEVVLFDKRDD